MNKAEFVAHFHANIRQLQNLNRDDANEITNVFLDSLMSALSKDGKIVFAGFGIFNVTRLNERTGMNFKTKQIQTLPPVNVVRFKPSTGFKQAVNI